MLVISPTRRRVVAEGVGEIGEIAIIPVGGVQAEQAVGGVGEEIQGGPGIKIRFQAGNDHSIGDIPIVEVHLAVVGRGVGAHFLEQVVKGVAVVGGHLGEVGVAQGVGAGIQQTVGEAPDRRDIEGNAGLGLALVKKVGRGEEVVGVVGAGPGQPVGGHHPKLGIRRGQGGGEHQRTDGVIVNAIIQGAVGQEGGNPKQQVRRRLVGEHEGEIIAVAQQFQGVSNGAPTLRRPAGVL